MGRDLVDSAEPAVVFASLAAACVPAVCDGCVIDVLEDGGDGYRIVYPRGDAEDAGNGHPSREAASAREILIRFDNHDTTDECRYRGTATFLWRSRIRGVSETPILELLIDRAMRTVAWQRSEDRALTAAAKADHLRIALHSSRQIGAAIGIVMSAHKLTDEGAFQLLRAASQHTHRKLRDIADDVIRTGWLDPTTLGRAPSPLGDGRLTCVPNGQQQADQPT
jgi:ANTAR domain